MILPILRFHEFFGKNFRFHEKKKNSIHVFNLKYHLYLSACWSYDTHERPTFKHILKTLDDIARSKFQAMNGDNFYSMQDDWKVEIDEMLVEIRFREEVS